MKKALKKAAALFLTCALMVQIIPIRAVASSASYYDKAISFLQAKSFYLGEILGSEPLPNGEKFEVQYLPSGESSYISYLEESDTIKVVIEEGIKKNEFAYKSNGQVFLDGERCEIMEQSNIQPASATGWVYSYYNNIDDVPGSNYWKTAQFKPASGSISFAIAITVGYTVGALAALLCQRFGIPSPYDFFIDMAATTISALASLGLTEGILNVGSSVSRAHNPTTIQYLEKTVVNGNVEGRGVEPETIYVLETYN